MARRWVKLCTLPVRVGLVLREPGNEMAAQRTGQRSATLALTHAQLTEKDTHLEVDHEGVQSAFERYRHNIICFHTLRTHEDDRGEVRDVRVYDIDIHLLLIFHSLERLFDLPPLISIQIGRDGIGRFHRHTGKFNTDYTYRVFTHFLHLFLLGCSHLAKCDSVTPMYCVPLGTIEDTHGRYINITYSFCQRG